MKYGIKILLLASIRRRLLELLGKEFEVIVGWLSHFEQHVGIDMLGSDFQMTADVMLRQLANVLRRLPGQVHANTAGDQDFLNAGYLAGLLASAR